MTGTLRQDAFRLSEVVTSKEETITVSEFEADHAFDLLMSDVDGYSPPEVQSTLQDKLQEITMLNDDITLQDSLVAPISVSGIEANDVCSLYKQFLEYEASDEALSYPESSIMSPMDSPGATSEDIVLGTLMSVQEKLFEEVGGNSKSSFFNGSVEVEEVDVANDLVVCCPMEDKLLRTVNGIHPKSNSVRMADSPKFAKLKKKKQTNKPPMRNLSLPATPRCTSPSAESISQEERKNMEIKLIEALALPAPKNTQKQNKNCKDSLSKTSKNNKDSLMKKLSIPGACPNKRKLPPLSMSAGHTPSRLLPVVSKRFKNNFEQSKCTKDPRLKDGATSDPRLNKPDYCAKYNTVLLKLTNIDEMNNSATNTATETVDDRCIVDMKIAYDTDHSPPTTPNKYTQIKTFDATIDHGSLVKSYTDRSRMKCDVGNVSNGESVPVVKDTGGGETLQIVFNDEETSPHGTDATNELIHGIEGEEDVPTTCDPVQTTTVSSDDSFGSLSVNELVGDDCSTELHIVEFSSLAAVEIKTEESVHGAVETAMSNETDNGTDVNGSGENMNGPVKPKRNFRKGRSKTPNCETNGNCTSDSENECDDDDRAYNRKHERKILPVAYVKTEEDLGYPPTRSASRTPNASRSASRHTSPSRLKSVCHRRRSGSPDSAIRSPDPYDDRFDSGEESEFSYHSDRSNNSDCENMDISNKLIELSNPVPYDIEQERKVRFLTGHASKSIGERRNIYAGGISHETTKTELKTRFKRFGRIQNITLHFRDRGDNYAFIVFEEPDNAMRAIEEGNDDPSYPCLDLCFGGRRKFVGGSYVDFDGNNRFLEECDKGSVNNRSEAPEDDFDKLLKRALTESKMDKEKTKKVPTTKPPEWT
jgi:hypothetical protein